MKKTFIYIAILYLMGHKTNNTISLIYEYYPQNIDPIYEDEYRRSPQFIKRQELCKYSPLIMKKDILIEKLNYAFGEESVQDYTLLHYFDPNIHLRIKTIDVEFSINISLLTEKYFIYISSQNAKNNASIRVKCKNKVEEERKLIFISIIKEIIGTTYQEISEEEAMLIVPNIAIGNKDFGEVTVANCLFTTHMW